MPNIQCGSETGYVGCSRVIERAQGFKYELRLNNKERTLLQQCAGLKRFVWNWGLAERLERYQTQTNKNRHTNSIN